MNQSLNHFSFSAPLRHGSGISRTQFSVTTRDLVLAGSAKVRLGPGQGGRARAVGEGGEDLAALAAQHGAVGVLQPLPLPLAGLPPVPASRTRRVGDRLDGGRLRLLVLAELDREIGAAREQRDDTVAACRYGAAVLGLALMGRSAPGGFGDSGRSRGGMTPSRMPAVRTTYAMSVTEPVARIVAALGLADQLVGDEAGNDEAQGLVRVHQRELQRETIITVAWSSHSDSTTAANSRLP